MIKIYGHSDDVVVIDGDIREELGAFNDERVITIGGEGAGLEVVASYGKGNGGVWQFTLRQVDEDVGVPWSVSITTEHTYSLAVVIDCPPGTPVDWDGKDESGAV